MDIDVGTRAILKMALLPPGSLLIMLFIGWLFARRFFGRFLILIATVALYALSTPVFLNLLASQLETVPAITPSQLAETGADGILVFLAGVRHDNPELGGGDALGPMSLERVNYGLFLHRKTGLPIMLSGGSVKGDTTPIAQLGGEWLQQQAGVTPLAVESQSRDTHENALNSAGALRAQGIEKVLLVTHAYHMPRALLNARAAGIDIIPAPFGFESVPPDLQGPDELGDWLPHPGYLGRSYLMLHEMLGLVWYGLTQH
ncbi:MAG: YdcF family protein [Sedimenticolaceae bacterium]